MNGDEQSEESYSNFYVEFEIHDNTQFERLIAVFSALKEAKEGESPPESDDNLWLSFFNAEELSTFWWPTDEERAEHFSRWYATPVPQRWSDPSLKHAWDFTSMIDAFMVGDYALLACKHIGENTGRLEFWPYGYPYGSTGCMEALIEAFGFKITNVQS
jgi:hypothetical protein